MVGTSKFASPRHLNGFVLNEKFPFEDGGSVSAAIGFKINNECYRLMLDM